LFLSLLPDLERARGPDWDLPGGFLVKSTGSAGFVKWALMFMSDSPNGRFKVVVIREPGSCQELVNLSSGWFSNVVITRMMVSLFTSPPILLCSAAQCPNACPHLGDNKY
jgi:hypothetical protein